MLFSKRTERILKWFLLILMALRIVIGEVMDEEETSTSSSIAPPSSSSFETTATSSPFNKSSSPTTQVTRFTPTPSSFRCSSDQVSLKHCPSGAACEDLGVECLAWCHCPGDCVYGAPTNATCNVHHEVQCEGPKTFNKLFSCQYCFQEPSDYACSEKLDCDAVAYDPYYLANCSVSQNVLCLGRREFLKRKKCNWTGGYRWSTAVTFSITLGGFGADRFYLGHWQEGIGKLVSFGGLGVWTLVDVVLVAIRYIGPADGSLYI